MPSLQKVRFKATSQLGRDWQLPADAEGIVICRYRAPGHCAPVDRLDVRFDRRVIWGGPADEFEIIEETDQPAKHS